MSAVSAVSAVSVVSAVSAVSAVTESSSSSSAINSSSDKSDKIFVVPGFDFSKLLFLQQSCASVKVMKVSSSLSVVTVNLSEGDLLCDKSTGNLRPLVSVVLRRPLFNALTNISHFGVSEVQGD